MSFVPEAAEVWFVMGCAIGATVVLWLDTWLGKREGRRASRKPVQPRHDPPVTPAPPPLLRAPSGAPRGFESPFDQARCVRCGRRGYECLCHGWVD